MSSLHKTQGAGWAEPLRYLAIGAVTAPLIGVLPLFGWLFGALCHELGHTATAWFFGRPAIPRISPAGIALTTHEDPNLFFVLSVPLMIGAALWNLLPPTAAVVCGAPLLLLLAIGHLGGVESMLLLGGHVGELSLAAVFLVRAWTGGWTASKPERALYASCGLFLVGSNVKLTVGLFASEAARTWYRGDGVGACQNDYSRLATEWGWTLEQVALGMTLPALVVLPLAIAIGQLLRHDSEPPVSRVRIGADSAGAEPPCAPPSRERAPQPRAPLPFERSSSDAGRRG